MAFSYLALPRQVVRLVPAPIQRDQEVGAAVTVGKRELGVAHLLAGRLCFAGSQRGTLLRRIGILPGKKRTPRRCCIVDGHFGCNWGCLLRQLRVDAWTDQIRDRPQRRAGSSSARLGPGVGRSRAGSRAPSVVPSGCKTT
jgi:hypothetical protein